MIEIRTLTDGGQTALSICARARGFPSRREPIARPGPLRHQGGRSGGAAHPRGAARRARARCRGSRRLQRLPSGADPGSAAADARPRHARAAPGADTADPRCPGPHASQVRDPGRGHGSHGIHELDRGLVDAAGERDRGRPLAGGGPRLHAELRGALVGRRRCRHGRTSTRIRSRWRRSTGAGLVHARPRHVARPSHRGQDRSGATPRPHLLARRVVRPDSRNARPGRHGRPRRRGRRRRCHADHTGHRRNGTRTGTPPGRSRSCRR